MKIYFETSYSADSLIYIVYEGIVYNVYGISPIQNTHAIVIYNSDELFKYLQEYSEYGISAISLWFDTNVISMVGSFSSSKIYLNRNQFNVNISVEIK